MPHIERRRASGHNLGPPLGSRQVLAAPVGLWAPSPQLPPAFSERWSMPSGSDRATEGFARARSASPGFSRSPRGAGVGGVRGPAEPSSFGRACEELARRAGLSPALQLLGRCWSAAPGCSTWRTERGAGSPRGRTGGADCGRMLAGLLRRCETSLERGQVPLAAPLTCHLVVFDLRGSLRFGVVGGGGSGEFEGLR